MNRKDQRTRANQGGGGVGGGGARRSRCSGHTLTDARGTAKSASRTLTKAGRAPRGEDAPRPLAGLGGWRPGVALDADRGVAAGGEKAGLPAQGQGWGSGQKGCLPGQEPGRVEQARVMLLRTYSARFSGCAHVASVCACGYLRNMNEASTWTSSWEAEGRAK